MLVRKIWMIVSQQNKNNNDNNDDNNKHHLRQIETIAGTIQAKCPTRVKTTTNV